MALHDFCVSSLLFQEKEMENQGMESSSRDESSIFRKVHVH
jgi:hypothetical protein